MEQRPNGFLTLIYLFVFIYSYLLVVPIDGSTQTVDSCKCTLRRRRNRVCFSSVYSLTNVGNYHFCVRADGSINLCAKDAVLMDSYLSHPPSPLPAPNTAVLRPLARQLSVATEFREQNATNSNAFVCRQTRKTFQTFVLKSHIFDVFAPYFRNFLQFISLKFNPYILSHILN